MLAIKTILVPTDFSEPSDAALKYGRELAIRFSATLHLLNVAPDVLISTLGAQNYTAVAPDLQGQVEADARRAVTALAKAGGQGAPRAVADVVVSASPATTILDYAKAHDVDVIVMGTHGRGALAHLVLGSVAERVVRMARCPVLTVRTPERDFVHAEPAAGSETDRIVER
jgi:nucleotide-binding universal stress UspA family protein